jgi:hypothetical protein
MRGLVLFAYLRSPQERAHPFQWLNTIAEYFEGRQEGNSMARRVGRCGADRGSFRLGQVRSRPLPGKRRRGFSVWCSQF